MISWWLKMNDPLMTPIEKLLTQQLQQSRDSEKSHKQTIQNMATAALKQIPRDQLIEILIKKRIIQRDWEQGANKYKLKQNE